MYDDPYFGATTESDELADELPPEATPSKLSARHAIIGAALIIGLFGLVLGVLLAKRRDDQSS
jgi:hypothetical protein